MGTFYSIAQYWIDHSQRISLQKTPLLEADYSLPETRFTDEPSKKGESTPIRSPPSSLTTWSEDLSAEVFDTDSNGFIKSSIYDLTQTMNDAQIVKLEEHYAVFVLINRLFPESMRHSKQKFIREFEAD